MTSYKVDISSRTLASQTSNHQRLVSAKPPSFGSKKAQHRVNFYPSDYSVICGRGKSSFNHIGNRRYRVLATMFIERYRQATTKATKSAIVCEIITLIRQADGNFWKFQSGAWVVVGDDYAREKVGASLRDLLHSTYRSSSKAKIAHRKIQRTKKRKENQEQQAPKTGKRLEPEMEPEDQQSDQSLVDNSQHSDDSSTTSSSWGSTRDSLGFEYWLEEDFFALDVF
jgi:hypothetical protein